MLYMLQLVQVSNFLILTITYLLILDFEAAGAVFKLLCVCG